MKKLLSLLSVLAISGTALPTTIAASPTRQKQVDVSDKIPKNLRLNNKSKTGLKKSWNCSI